MNDTSQMQPYAASSITSLGLNRPAKKKRRKNEPMQGRLRSRAMQQAQAGNASAPMMTNGMTQGDPYAG